MAIMDGDNTITNDIEQPNAVPTESMNQDKLRQSARGLVRFLGEEESTISDTARSAPPPPSTIAKLSPQRSIKFSVPETPRWRFVSAAKKTEGYSSVSAGNVVQGQTSEEIAKKYKKPTAGASSDDIDEDDGSLGEVGKIVFNGEEDEFEETFEGTFGGFGTSDDANGENDNVVCDTEEELGSIDELATFDGEVLEDPVLHSSANEEFIEGMVLQAKEVDASSTIEDELDQMEKQPDEADCKQHVDTTNLTQVPSDETSEGLPKPDDDDDDDDEEETTDKRKKYKIWGLYALIMMLLIVIVTLMGVMLNNKDDNNNANIDASKLRGIEIDAKEIFCPEVTNKFHLTLQLGLNPNEISWKVLDRCTLETLYKCSQCYTDSLPNHPVSFVGCLPSVNDKTEERREYVLQLIGLAGSPGVGYTMRYNDEVIFEAAKGNNNFTNFELNHFGELGGCSEAPSMSPAPSVQPSFSARPTSNPSESPSVSLMPTTSPPSDQPSSTSKPSHRPSTQPSSQPSSQPSESPSSQPSERPSPMPSSVPSFSSHPTVIPSLSPSTSIPPLRNIVFPPHNPVIPCRESVEAELVGRIYQLDGEFCGICQWKLSAFNCYQRINFLVSKYAMTQVAARQSLIERAQCSVPAGGFDGLGPWLQSQIEGMPYCNNVPIVLGSGVELPTTPPPTKPPTHKPTTSSQPTFPISEPTASVFE